MIEECIWGLIALRDAIVRQKNNDEPTWSPFKKVLAYMLYGFLFVMSVIIIGLGMLYNKLIELRDIIRNQNKA